jgi:P4 family phage/plasmid primase-like protien
MTSRELPGIEFGSDSENGGKNKAAKDLIYGTARKLLDSYSFKTMRDTMEVLVYDKGVYRAENGLIAEFVQETLGRDASTHVVAEVEGHIQRSTLVDRGEFDRDPDILNVKNGLLNLVTGELKSHSEDHLSTIQIPVNYDPCARCHRIMKFLTQTLSRESISLIVRMFGYVIVHSTRYEKAFMFVGTGSNGKGTVIKLVEAFVGSHNCSHVSLQELDADRFAAADLYGKLVNTCADLKVDRLLNTGMFKTLVSGDTIRAQKKHKPSFTFRNYATLVYSANKIPESDDKTYAFYKRWVIINFDRLFEGDDRDNTLIEKLTTQEELSGLLNLALVGLRKLRQEGRFAYMPIERIKRQYETGANDVAAFLESECIVRTEDPGWYTRTTRLYSAYFGYCKSNGKRPLEMNVFGKELADRGIVKHRVRNTVSRDYYYIGIKLRSQGMNQLLG